MNVSVDCVPHTYWPFGVLGCILGVWGTVSNGLVVVVYVKTKVTISINNTNILYVGRVNNPYSVFNKTLRNFQDFSSFI